MPHTLPTQVQLQANLSMAASWRRQEWKVRSRMHFVVIFEAVVDTSRCAIHQQ
jgi:hypothetical protein